MHPWRARLSRWFSPLAATCPLSPNAITIVALVLNLLAAFCFAAGLRNPKLFVAGIVLLIVGGLADAFDGIVARVQQKESRFGDFLDHFADRMSDTFLVAGWLVGSQVRPTLAMLALIVVMLNGYTGTQIEATFKERSYEGIGRGEFVLCLIVYPLGSYILSSNGWMGLGLASFTITEWMTFLLLAAGILGIQQRLALARRIANDEERMTDDG